VGWVYVWLSLLLLIQDMQPSCVFDKIKKMLAAGLAAQVSSSSQLRHTHTLGWAGGTREGVENRARTHAQVNGAAELMAAASHFI
jgi:hypothetical protein